MTSEQQFQYLLRLGDNALILGQRLSEWCGHGPVLEQDIALTNIALDLVGQARSWLAYAGQVEGRGRDEDQLAFLRDAPAFRNVLLVEQPNRDWAYTMVRQFFFDAFHYHQLSDLCHSTDTQVAAIAEKSLKEVTYHLRYSSEWVIRLGDGTEESHTKMQRALDDYWPYHGEALIVDDLDLEAAKTGIGANLESIQPRVRSKIREILEEATLLMPSNDWMQKGGKQGRHSEHLGFILAEMQFLQRAYPGATW